MRLLTRVGREQIRACGRQAPWDRVLTMRFSSAPWSTLPDTGAEPDRVSSGCAEASLAAEALLSACAALASGWLASSSGWLACRQGAQSAACRKACWLRQNVCLMHGCMQPLCSCAGWSGLPVCPAPAWHQCRRPSWPPKAACQGAPPSALRCSGAPSGCRACAWEAVRRWSEACAAAAGWAGAPAAPAEPSGTSAPRWASHAAGPGPCWSWPATPDLPCAAPRWRSSGWRAGRGPPSPASPWTTGRLIPARHARAEHAALITPGCSGRPAHPHDRACRHLRRTLRWSRPCAAEARHACRTAWHGTALQRPARAPSCLWALWSGTVQPLAPHPRPLCPQQASGQRRERDRSSAACMALHAVKELPATGLPCVLTGLPLRCRHAAALDHALHHACAPPAANWSCRRPAACTHCASRPFCKQACSPPLMCVQPAPGPDAAATLLVAGTAAVQTPLPALDICLAARCQQVSRAHRCTMLLGVLPSASTARVHQRSWLGHRWTSRAACTIPEAQLWLMPARQEVDVRS